MVIVKPEAGLGNQFYQYAIARTLAHKLNAQLKLDLTGIQVLHDEKPRSHVHYRLGSFNILENIATPEEIKKVKTNGLIPNSFRELENIQGDVYIQHYWMFSDEYFSDINDIIRKEFTLKKPFNPIAESWKQKILSAECSVSMNFRHGDKLYNPNLQKMRAGWTIPLPLDYYYTCIDILKQRYNNLTVFVFSDNMPWVKENLHLDVPTEFVEGCETDDEEFILISLCNHNVVANSSFSRAAASLNSNPEKKVFLPKMSDSAEVQKYLDLLKTNKNFLNECGTKIFVPFDSNNQPEITQRPFFSLLLIVNDDTVIPLSIYATLDSLFGQDYNWYEVIIIDNASNNGSDKICQDAVKGKKNVTYKRLDKKINNVTAWNIALDMAQGQYISFIKIGDRFLVNALTNLYLTNEWYKANIIHMFNWLEENESGNVILGDKKFLTKHDEHFKEEKLSKVAFSKGGINAARLLLDRQINSLLGTKVYNRKFLIENEIKFAEQLAEEDAEIFFQTETFFKSKYRMYIQNALYITPIQNSRNYSTARIDIQRKAMEGDFQILSVSDNKASVWKPAWFQKNGIGYQIQSYAGKLEIVAKTTVDGQIYLHLRGIDIRSSEDPSKRIPYWIDYTKFIVNDKVIFDKVTPAWHDQTYFYKMDAKANEEIKFQVEWIPHK